MDLLISSILIIIIIIIIIIINKVVVPIKEKENSRQKMAQSIYINESLKCMFPHNFRTTASN